MGIADDESHINAYFASSSPNSEPNIATVKFEETPKNIQNMTIIGKLKEKRTEIETIEQTESQVRAPGKRKSEGAHRPSSRSAAEEDGQGAIPGWQRWRRNPQRTPERQAGSMDSCLDKTPSTPEMFDFDDLEKSETREKGMKKIIGRYDISTPPSPEKHEVGVQAHLELEDKEVQTSGEEGETDVNDEGFDMTDVECID